MTNKQEFHVGDVFTSIEGCVEHTVYDADARFGLSDRRYIRADHSGGGLWKPEEMRLVRRASPAEPAKGGWVPKVGERVRVATSGFGLQSFRGQLATVTFLEWIDGEKDFRVLLDIEGAGGGWAARPRHLEPAPEEDSECPECQWINCRCADTLEKRDPYAEHRLAHCDEVVRNAMDSNDRYTAMGTRKSPQESLLRGLRSEHPKPRRPNSKYDGTKWQDWPAGDERNEA